jgi:MoaA/NifB/PqqE/SkfB family radical SAM enzyme
MTPETFKSIVDQLLVGEKHVTKERIVLHGLGEPLLSPYLWENLNYLEEKGFTNVDFSDNGTLLTAENIKKLLKYKCLNLIKLSLNSTDKKTMEEINTGSNFDKVVSNIKRFIKLWQKEKLFKLVIQLMVTKKSEESEEKLRHLLGEGDYQVLFKRINNFSGLVPQNNYTFPNEVYNPECVFAETSVMFHWDGDMVGCCDDDTRKQIICNQRDGIYSAATLKKKKEMQEQFKLGDYTNLPICKKCLGKS